jgi:orotate phosphoribosyltransferase
MASRVNYYHGREKVAQLIIEAGAAGVAWGERIQFASGITSPGCYIDCRKLPAKPDIWERIIWHMTEWVEEDGFEFDSLCSVESGGISHASVMAVQLQLPSAYVRKKSKGHGVGGMIAGDLSVVAGKRTALVEDMGTTGGSAAKAIIALREAGATVTDVLLLVAYDFPEQYETAEQLDVTLHTLCTFEDILHLLELQKAVSEQHAELVRQWLTNPRAPWAWPEAA